MSVRSVADVEADVIPAMVARIVQRFDPVRVILFGSYARGEASEQSDVDLLVVLDEVADQRQASVEIGGLLGGMGVAKDVLVTTPRTIARRGALIGTVLEPALREGKLMYDRDGDESAPISAIEEMDVSPDERDEQTRRWLGMARQDLMQADTLAAHSYAAGAAFHAQQAAEKTIKAALIRTRLEAPRTHNLNELRDLLPDDWQTRRSFPDLGNLSKWAVHSRYPGPWPEPTDDDARVAIEQARAIYDQVAADLALRGLSTDEAP